MMKFRRIHAAKRIAEGYILHYNLRKRETVSHIISERRTCDLKIVEWAIECHSMTAYAISTIHTRHESKVRREGACISIRPSFSFSG